MDLHPSNDAIERFLLGRSEGAEASLVMRHLLSCPACLPVARKLARAIRLLPYAAPPTPEQRSAYDAYDQVFSRLSSCAASTEASVHHEEQRAADLWHQLDGMPQDRRLLLVQNHRRFQTWGLFQYVLTKARLVVSLSPLEAIELADLALAIAGRPLGVSDALAWDLCGTALVARANAERFLCEFEAAKTTFERAWAALENGTGDLLERATAHTLHARLLRDLGEFDEALVDLAAARVIYRRVSDAYNQGRTLLQEADLLGVLDPRAGIRKIEEALPLLKNRSEPRLEIMAFGRLAWFLDDAGKPWEALSVYDRSASLYRGLNDTYALICRYWLGGRIYRGLCDPAQAEDLTLRAWEGFRDLRYTHDLAVCSLDLAQLYLLQHRAEEAKRMMHELAPVLHEAGLHPDGLRRWLELGEHTDPIAYKQAALYFIRFWRRPPQPAQISQSA